MGEDERWPSAIAVRTAVSAVRTAVLHVLIYYSDLASTSTTARRTHAHACNCQLWCMSRQPESARAGLLPIVHTAVLVVATAVLLYTTTS